MGLAAGLAHGQELGEHLSGMPVTGQPAVHQHANMDGKGLHIGLPVRAYSIASYIRPSTTALPTSA